MRLQLPTGHSDALTTKNDGEEIDGKGKKHPSSERGKAKSSVGRGETNRSPRGTPLRREEANPLPEGGRGHIFHLSSESLPQFISAITGDTE